MSASVDKLPPRNQEAEEAVIGSLLIGGEIQRLTLEPSDFWDESLATFFMACQEVAAQGANIDSITVADALDRSGKLASVGGAARISHLIGNTPTSLDLPYYADIVKRLSMFRKLVLVGMKISNLGYQGQNEISHNLELADQYLLELRKANSSVTTISPPDRVKQQMERYDVLLSEGKSIALPTKLIDLDYQLGGGLFPGDLIILGARPGMGKTTILQQIANGAAEHSPVLFASGEMNADSLTDREIATLIKVPITRVRAGDYDSDLYVNIIASFEAIQKRQCYLFVRSRSNQFTTANLYQAALSIQLRHGLSLIVVDYLGLLQDRYGTNPVERLGYISAELKSIAMELHVPVLCAHQLNRGTETLEDKRPQLHHLRDSGNIEQDADIVLFLYRDNYYQRAKGTSTEVIIAKQRQGPGVDERVVEVFFDTKDQTYKNATRGEDSIL